MTKNESNENPSYYGPFSVFHYVSVLCNIRIYPKMALENEAIQTKVDLSSHSPVTVQSQSNHRQPSIEKEKQRLKDQKWGE